MNRRQWLSRGGLVVAGLVGASGIASATTDPTARPPAERGLRGHVTGGTTVRSGDTPAPVRTTYSGSGSETVDGVEVNLDGPTAFLIDGGADLDLDVFDATGAAVAGIDNWAGLGVTDLDPGTYRLEVAAAGEWTITLVETPVYEADDVATAFPVGIEGSSSNVYGPFDFSGERSLTYSASGGERTVLSLQTASGETFFTPVNGPGPVETTIEFDVAEEVVWVSVFVVSGEYSLSIVAA
ncbi:hypothetical protein [Halorarum salinum]|uniref:Uncharacterized protein n=1 Tax=Halorarum salinum TaxID=2743089 RepID=A0A7D5QFA5_9EURY|nr:hypothetical protein [Halobaculum salinum]QLG61242.1 hypothetical protein HUG12_05635 [Halobaculum salinum]